MQIAALSLVLAFLFGPALAAEGPIPIPQETPGHAPPLLVTPHHCYELRAALANVNVAFPIARAGPLPKGLNKEISEWYVATFPKNGGGYDLYGLIIHEDDSYAVIAGWREDPDLKQPSLCKINALTDQQFKQLVAIVQSARAAMPPKSNPVEPPGNAPE